MSLYDYEKGLEIAAKDYPFYAIIQAAMRRAGTDNLNRLKALFPQVLDELIKRYNAPGGRLPGDEEEQICIRIVNTPAPKYNEEEFECQQDTQQT